MSSGQAINVTIPRPVVGPERFSSCRHWMVLSSAKALCKREDDEGEGGRRLAARKLQSGGQNRRPGRSNTLKHRFRRAWPGWSGSLGPAAAHGPASSISATLLARFRECAGAACEGKKRVAGGEAAGAGATCPYLALTHPDGGSAAVCVVAARLRPARQPRSRLRKPELAVHNLIGHCTLRQMRLPGAPRDSVLVYSCDEHS